MIEELADKISLFTRVKVKELDVEGEIYERGVADSGHTIYGIELDRTVWIGGLCTEVWHCKREDLALTYHLREGVRNDIQDTG